MTLEEILELHRGGDLAAAEHGYRAHLAAEPEDADAWHLLGVLLHQRGDSAAAMEPLLRAVQIAPDVARLHLSLGGVLLQTDQEEAARGAFLRALELDPNLVEAHSMLGHLQLREGDIDDAESRFKIGRRATDIFENENPLILLGLGNVHLARGDAVNASKFLARAAELKPDDAAIQTTLGQSLFAQGSFAFAEQAFSNALRLQPDSGLAKLFLARSRMRQNKDEEAREDFSELLAENKQAFGANAGLGDIARKSGQTVKALKFYRRALELDPTHAGVANACAWCMEKLGDLEGAVRYLSDGVERSADPEALRPPLAELLDRLGRGDEAAQVRASLGRQA
ncbi:MAG: tetratricopeptide repeat protein [Rudaea sp.]|uniref:tetratricopeptide repeat protein n=1 Tax=unclassified Rudaea TaxID=2627037 RepID=UPI0010F86C17|nr:MULTISPECIES: tetratricopeptide repeat protein [unclassified Rudaea]MBN8886878.1 tetratricopeptide repeat protein [Rudaea sp.]